MDSLRSLALQRVRILLQHAEEAFPHHPQRSHTYVKQARRIAMKVRLSLPRHLKRKFCKRCHHYLKPGVNSRVRTRSNMLIVSCLDCKKLMKYPLR